MTLSRSLHLEPYRDPSGLGFALITEYTGSRPPCRQRTIVAVGWNFTEDRALFVNGAGLVVPSWHNRDALAPLLRRHTVRQAFGRVIGDGQFALKPAELKALEGSGRLKPWLVHYLPQPAGYLDDADPGRPMSRPILRPSAMPSPGTMPPPSNWGSGAELVLSCPGLLRR